MDLMSALSFAIYPAGLADSGAPIRIHPYPAGLPMRPRRIPSAAKRIGGMGEHHRHHRKNHRPLILLGFLETAANHRTNRPSEPPHKRFQ
jgi:hypothetical protein